jgi:hypothetical protein
MSNYSNNTRPSRLRQNDTVTFQLPNRELAYTVIKLPKSGCIALRRTGNAPNRAIFTALDLGDREIVAMATKAFGYAPKGSKWPHSEDGDYAAQCRLVNALYAKIDALGIDPVAAPPAHPFGHGSTYSVDH